MTLSIRNRILLGIALPIAMFVGFTVWLSMQLATVKATMQNASEQSVQYALLATQMDKNVVQIQQFLSDISATRGLDGLDDGFKKAQENMDAMQSSLTKFEAHFKATGDQAALQSLQTIRSSVGTYYRVGQDMAHAYVSKGPAEGNKQMAAFDAASENLQKAL